MNRFVCVLALAILTLAPLGCVQPSGLSDFEGVMCEGDNIVVSQAGGVTLSIAATAELGRRFEILGNREEANLLVRQERWNGSRGLYTPNAGEGMRLVAEEGQQHFDSIAEALAWLPWVVQEHEYATTSNGLVVAWRYSDASGDTRHSSVLGVQIWQVIIRGEKPSDFPPTTDTEVTFRAHGPRCAAASIADIVPLEPISIEGRMYSGRARAIMQEKGISATDVEYVLSNSQYRSERHGHIMVNAVHLHGGARNLSVYWIMVDDDGYVWLLG